MHIRTRVRLDAARVKKKADQASFKSLGHAGGTIRKTAYRSIRKRKNPSRPGSPPSSPTGRLRRSFRYEVDRRTPGVVVGPVNEIAGRLWNLHEFGGIANAQDRRLPSRSRQRTQEDARLVRPAERILQLRHPRRHDERLASSTGYHSVVNVSRTTEWKLAWILSRMSPD